LKIAGEKIAAVASCAKAPRVARCGLVIAVVKISSPAGVTTFWICVENAREWKAELNESTLRAHRSLRRHDRNSIE